MIFVISVRLLIHWNTPSYNALQMLNFIMKSYHGLMFPTINTVINLSPEQILMQKYIPGPINDNLRRRPELIILCMYTVVKLMWCPLTVRNSVLIISKHNGK